jgi:hypothetical protein
VFNSVFGLLPKAATQALIALVVTGGAIGASAAAGGPNVPAETLKAVGLANENANEHAEDNAKALAKGKAKREATSQAPGQAMASATAVVRVDDAEGAGDNGLKGLCNAYTKGGLGQRANPKGEGVPAAAPLARIDDARGSESRADFCEGVLEDHKATTASTAGDEGEGKALGKLKTRAEETGPGKSADAPGKAR